MCREGAWVELTIEVTSVEDSTTHSARIFLFSENPANQASFFILFLEHLTDDILGLYAIEYKVKQ